MGILRVLMLACLFSAVFRAEAWDDLDIMDRVGSIRTQTGDTCVATLIDRDIVLTAAHCLYDARGDEVAPRHLTFYQKSRPSIRVAAIVRHPDFDPKGGATTAAIDADMGVVILDQFASELSPITIGQKVLLGENVIVGRPNSKIMQNCTVVDSTETLFTLDCEVSLGDSGAPVFRTRGERGYGIVGIISAFETEDDTYTAIVTVVDIRLDVLIEAIKEQKITGIPLSSAMQKPLAIFNPTNTLTLEELDAQLRAIEDKVKESGVVPAVAAIDIQPHESEIIIPERLVCERNGNEMRTDMTSLEGLLKPKQHDVENLGQRITKFRHILHREGCSDSDRVHLADLRNNIDSIMVDQELHRADALLECTTEKIVSSENEMDTEVERGAESSKINGIRIRLNKLYDFRKKVLDLSVGFASAANLRDRLNRSIKQFEDLCTAEVNF